jgi:hypothetical protein
MDAAFHVTKAGVPVPRQRDPTGPSPHTIKRLFGQSGNRCAFSRCTAPVVDGATVVGEVCHIKGTRPGSARYDDHQSAVERHAFDNLILMCGRHHTVIDDDEEAYTVERLVKMKAEHESQAVPLGEDFAERGAQLLMNQAVLSVNQSGGFTANIMNFSSQPSPLYERQIDALTKLGDDFRKALDYLQSMTRSAGFEGELSKEEYWFLSEKAVKSAYEIFSNTRLLIPLNLAALCERFFSFVHECKSNFDAARHPATVDGHQRAAFWDKAGEIAHKELPGILKQIETGSRNLIHEQSLS